MEVSGYLYAQIAIIQDTLFGLETERSPQPVWTQW
jgi:hypothetical protein